MPVFGAGISAIEMGIAGEEETQSLGIVLFRHACDPAEIDGTLFKELYPGQPAPAGVPDQGKRLEQFAVQSVIGVPACKILLFTECLQRREIAYEGIRFSFMDMILI